MGTGIVLQMDTPFAGWNPVHRTHLVGKPKTKPSYWSRSWGSMIEWSDLGGAENSTQRHTQRDLVFSLGVDLPPSFYIEWTGPLETALKLPNICRTCTSHLLGRLQLYNAKCIQVCQHHSDLGLTHFERYTRKHNRIFLGILACPSRHGNLCDCSMVNVLDAKGQHKRTV